MRQFLVMERILEMHSFSSFLASLYRYCLISVVRLTELFFPTPTVMHLVKIEKSLQVENFLFSRANNWRI